MSSSYALRTAQYDTLHSLGLAAEKLPDMLFSCHFAKRDFMTQHEGAIKAVQAGYWNLDGVLAQTAWDFTVKQLRESGELSKDPPYADYVLADLSRRGRGAGAHLHSVTSPPRRTAVALERRRSMLTDRSNDTLITRRSRS